MTVTQPHTADSLRRGGSVSWGPCCTPAAARVSVEHTHPFFPPNQKIQGFISHCRAMHTGSGACLRMFGSRTRQGSLPPTPGKVLNLGFSLQDPAPNKPSVHSTKFHVATSLSPTIGMAVANCVLFGSWSRLGGDVRRTRNLGNIRGSTAAPFCWAPPTQVPCLLP